VARTFMARFYGALERLPRDAALREAQLACLTNKLNCIAEDDPEPIDTRSTFYWSGFNLYGTPDRLHFPAKYKRLLSNRSPFHSGATMR
jgi:hypothetical protein